jgi:hypothetical protein
MKKRIGIAALVVGVLIALAVFVHPPASSSVSSPQPVVVETPATNVPVATAAVASVPTNPAPVTPVPAPAVSVETNAPETNPPPVAPVVPAPETNPAPAAPVVSIPATNPPAAAEISASPTNRTSCSMVRNLLTDSFTNNLTDNQEIFYRFRAGYERADFGNAKNTWFLGAKFYYRPQSWRDGLKDGTNFFESLLVPDTLGEIEHTAIEITSDSGSPTTEDGVRIGAGFFWPWLDWRSKAADDRPDGELQFSLGPTVNGGVEENTTGSDPDMNWFDYGGVRLAASPDAFVEYTVGRNGDLTGLRRQLVGEIPIYRKARSDFRYVLRGVWNTSSSQNGNFFEAAVLVEFPFEALEHPSSFRDLIPFIK